MEDIHNLKNVSWITEEPVQLQDYFNKYHELLDNISNYPHNDKRFRDEALRSFFPQVPTKEEDPGIGDTEVADIKATFDLNKLGADCSVDMLTIQGELLPEDVSLGPHRHSGRITNWYAGSFRDGIIPDGGAAKLATLAAQEQELHLRDTVRDYARLRNRLLKYFYTVRMIIDQENSPEPTPLETEGFNESLRDIVLNVRVQRPYHKKTHMKKACNRFPTHSQEMVFLGSQKLTELRDAVVCINDLCVNYDLSDDPNFYRLAHLPNNSVLFPSGFIYINGVFYEDKRNAENKMYSSGIIEWAKKYPDIGEMTVKDMSDVTFQDLNLRLGYPYVFLHQGTCEHIITFTDVRLHHQHDVQDPARYPLLRGQATKLSVKCHICNLNLANWIVKEDQRIPIPNAHLCDRCLKSFCYNKNSQKIHNIKVYPFMDEFKAQQKKAFDPSKFSASEKKASSLEKKSSKLADVEKKSSTNKKKSSVKLEKKSSDVEKTSLDVEKESTDVEKESTDVEKESTDVEKKSSNAGKKSSDKEKSSNTEKRPISVENESSVEKKLKEN